MDQIRQIARQNVADSFNKRETTKPPRKIFLRWKQPGFQKNVKQQFFVITIKKAKNRPDYDVHAKPRFLICETPYKNWWNLVKFVEFGGIWSNLWNLVSQRHCDVTYSKTLWCHIHWAERRNRPSLTTRKTPTRSGLVQRICLFQQTYYSFDFEKLVRNPLGLAHALLLGNPYRL